jgi:hypothetical protein
MSQSEAATTSDPVSGKPRAREQRRARAVAQTRTAAPRRCQSTQSRLPHLPARQAPLLRFGLVADVQYADADDAVSFHGVPRFYRGALQGLDRALGALARDGAAFVINLGDSVDGKQRERAEEGWVTGRGRGWFWGRWGAAVQETAAGCLTGAFADAFDLYATSAISYTCIHPPSYTDPSDSTPSWPALRSCRAPTTTSSATTASTTSRGPG